MKWRLWAYSALLFYVAAWVVCLALYVHAEWWVSQFPHDAVPWHLEAWRGVWENNQSEMLQGGVGLLVPALLTLVAISKFSQEGEQQVQRDRLESKIDALLAQARPWERREDT